MIIIRCSTCKRMIAEDEELSSHLITVDLNGNMVIPHYETCSVLHAQSMVDA